LGYLLVKAWGWQWDCLLGTQWEALLVTESGKMMELPLVTALEKPSERWSAILPVTALALVSVLLLEKMLAVL
jgi:hypothetical protein